MSSEHAPGGLPGVGRSQGTLGEGGHSRRTEQHAPRQPVQDGGSSALLHLLLCGGSNSYYYYSLTLTSRHL